MQGTTYDPITITDGESLGDVAGAIRALGAPVSAVVLNDGTKQYLSVTNLDTGFTGADASTALQISENSTGTQGQSLGFAQVHGASNALFTVDGLQFTRQSNTVTDAIPGTTLTLKGQTNTTETRVVRQRPARPRRSISRTSSTPTTTSSTSPRSSKRWAPVQRPTATRRSPATPRCAA